MKVKAGILTGLLAILSLAACNRDGDPLFVPYFSTLVFLQNDTVFTEQSIDSRELYDTLFAHINEIAIDYAVDTVLETTWGERKKFYHLNDSIARDCYREAINQLDTVLRADFNAKRADAARDGSFVLRVSLFVAREQRIAESHSINYVFNRFGE